MTPEEINQKAIEYAELKHKEEADNPAFERDISESQIDFARGYTAALSKVAEKELELDEKKNCRTCNELGHPCWLHDPSNPDNKVAEMPTEEEAFKKIEEFYDKSNKIKLDVDKLHEIQASLNKNAEFLDNISKNLIQLQKEYPPVQTQNIVFTNATNEDVTNILTDIIKNRSTSLTISFVFGALFGSLIGVALFKFGPVIYQKIKNKPKQGSEK